MFENPGKKLKTVAVALFWLGTIASVILAFFFGVEERYHSYYYSYGGYSSYDFNPIAFFPWIIGGPLSSYIFSLCLAGLGELIENSAKMVSKGTVDVETKNSEHDEKRNTDKQVTSEITALTDEQSPKDDSEQNGSAETINEAEH